MTARGEIAAPGIVTDDLQLLWATPLFTRRHAGADPLNAALRDEVAALQAADEGVRRSNYGGWQSAGNLFERPTPAVEALHALCAQAVVDALAAASGGAVEEVGLLLYGWANVLQPGGYHTYHQHPGSHLSGVYYVQTGTPAAPDAGDKAGVLCFYEPRGGGALATVPGLGFGEDFDLRPEAGLLVLFPSYLGHSVHPHAGPGDRVTVAFNAYLEA